MTGDTTERTQNERGLWDHADVHLSAAAQYLIWAKVLNFFVPHFPHLKKWDANTTSFTKSPSESRESTH